MKLRKIRYNRSPKGRASDARYQSTPKGKLSLLRASVRYRGGAAYVLKHVRCQERLHQQAMEVLLSL